MADPLVMRWAPHSVVCILATVGLYVTRGGTSVAATWLVELEGRLGFPVWWLGAGLTVVMLINVGMSFRGDARPAPQRDLRVAPTRRAPAAATTGNPPGHSGWYEDAAERARRLALGPHAHLRYDEARGLPFTLVLRGVTQEQARRAVETFTAFLAAIPWPPKARVYLESSPDVSTPLLTLVTTACKKNLPADACFVVQQGSGVDVCFPNADPRWITR